MSKINDLDMKQWKHYDDILTDSLWVLGGRDKYGAHKNSYHGNFIPQIPNQLMRRFTKKGDVVLDLFLGHGTSLIEARRLGRHGIGVELNPEVARVACNNIKEEIAVGGASTEVIVADSTTPSAKRKVLAALNKLHKNRVHLILLHPPYYDIIKFSDAACDLSNMENVYEFTKKFGDVIANFIDLLDSQHYLAVVIGDKYANGEWVPLGFYLMQETLKRGNGLILKSILVKNMSGNRAKLNQESLWRYRA
ncbi:MAG: DNA methyltransferase, partial [Salinispira sp.]